METVQQQTKQGEHEKPKAKQGHAVFCWAVGEICMRATTREYEAERQSQEATSNQKLPNGEKNVWTNMKCSVRKLRVQSVVSRALCGHRLAGTDVKS